MNWNKIDRDLAHVAGIIGECLEGRPLPELEKDFVLGKLREIYEDIKFSAPESEITPLPETVQDDVAPEEDEKPDVSITEEGMPEPPKVKTTREALRSLYDDCVDDEPAPVGPTEGRGGEIKPEPVPVKAYHNEQVKVLGETIGNGGQTIADSYASRNNVPDVASAIGSAPVGSLRSSIGVNDKFLMVRDLFGSDNALYEKTIDDLEAFDNLDDAFIYLYEHYSLNPDSEAVKLLVDLLSRKLS